MNKFMLLGLMGLILIACNKEDQAEVDDQLIQDYLTENNIDAKKDESGVYYYIEEPGNSKHPDLNSVVKIIYKGYFLDGQQFDSSNGESINLELARTIKGWQIGIPYFGKGAKGKLFIPSGLAYGDKPKGSIPANSVLIFDIELLEFW